VNTKPIGVPSSSFLQSLTVDRIESVECIAHILLIKIGVCLDHFPSRSDGDVIFLVAISVDVTAYGRAYLLYLSMQLQRFPDPVEAG
jgi:hypothetical protein